MLYEGDPPRYRKGPPNTSNTSHFIYYPFAFGAASRSILSFCFASCAFCHGILLGESAPPAQSGITWSAT